MNIERYGVYFVELDPTRGSEMAKTRPAVVVSMDEMNNTVDTVVVPADAKPSSTLAVSNSSILRGQTR